MRVVFGCLIIAFCTPAMAQKAVHVQGLLGFDAQAEYDEVKIEGQTLAEDGDDDLEGNFGLQATYDQALAPSWRLGGRLAFMTAELEDVDESVTTIDAGLWSRFVFKAGSITPFLAAGAGLTWVSYTPDTDGSDIDLDPLTGIGWHVIGGAGLEFDTEGPALSVGLYLSHQAADLEGEAKAGGQSADVEYEGGVVSRALLAFGVGF